MCRHVFWTFLLLPIVHSLSSLLNPLFSAIQIINLLSSPHRLNGEKAVYDGTFRDPVSVDLHFFIFPLDRWRLNVLSPLRTSDSPQPPSRLLSRRPETGCYKRASPSASGASCTRCLTRPTLSFRYRCCALHASSSQSFAVFALTFHPQSHGHARSIPCNPLEPTLESSFHHRWAEGRCLTSIPEASAIERPPPRGAPLVGAHSSRNTADRPAARSQAGSPLGTASPPSRERDPTPAPSLRC